MVVLFGILGFLVGKEKFLELSGYTVAVVCWFSLIALLVDLVFRRRKLSVVRAYDRLAYLAIDRATGGEIPVDDVRTLLYISSENPSIEVSVSAAFLPAVFI